MKIKSSILVWTVFVAISCVFVQCKSNEKAAKKKSKQKADIEILSAIAESWVAGAKGHGSGVQLKMKMVSHSKGLKIDRICFHNSTLVPKVIKSNNIMPASYEILKGDTLMLKANLLDNALTLACYDSIADDEAMIHYINANSESKQFLVKYIIKHKAKPRP